MSAAAVGIVAVNAVESDQPHLLDVLAALTLIGVSIFVSVSRARLSSNPPLLLCLLAVNFAAVAVLYFYPSANELTFALLLVLLAVAGFVPHYAMAMTAISAICVLFAALMAAVPVLRFSSMSWTKIIDFSLNLALIYSLSWMLAALVSRHGEHPGHAPRAVDPTQDLVGFGRHLTQSLDEQQIVAKCPRAVRDIMRCDAVEILLMDGTEVRKGSFCADDPSFDPADSTSPGLYCPGSLAQPGLPELSFRSRLATRLRSDTQDFGELRIYSREPRRWTDEEQRKFEFLGAQTAIALQMVALFKTIENQARTDGLTDLCNRRYFYERLEEEMERSRRKHRECTIVLLDLDEFKQVNDTHGHAEGDKVLIYVAQLLKRTTRSTDLLARYGGDEFTMLLPETHPTRAKMLVERLRNELQCHPAPCGVVRLSAGVASYPEHAGDVRQLIECADRALYRAKELGRNRTEIYSES